MTFCCEFWLKRRFPRHDPLSPLKQVKFAETCDSMRHPTREKQPSMDLSSDYGLEGLRFESPRARIFPVQRFAGAKPRFAVIFPYAVFRHPDRLHYHSQPPVVGDVGTNR